MTDLLFEKKLGLQEILVHVTEKNVAKEQEPRKQRNRQEGQFPIIFGDTFFFRTGGTQWLGLRQVVNLGHRLLRLGHGP